MRPGRVFASCMLAFVYLVSDGAAAARIRITEFSSGTSSFTLAVTAGPDGNVWFSEGGVPSRIGKITTAGVVTEYSSGLSHSAGLQGIAAGADGNLWFTEIGGGATRIGRVKTKRHHH